MSSSSKPAEGFQGIPPAVFIENVEEYMKGQSDPHDVVFAGLATQFENYKKLETRFTAQRDNLKYKIPEIETTLEAVLHMKEKHGKGTSECEYELSGGTFATAVLEDTGNVYLWIGAGLMVEYPIDEAIELLTSNSSSAKEKITYYEQGIKFLQEQIVIMQVSMARIHNWTVVARRQGKLPPAK